MVFEIKLYSLFKEHSPNGKTSFNIEVPESTSVASVLEMLNLNEKIDKIILLNGRPVKLDTFLGNGDLLVVLPVAEGG
ncbi:MAG: MoaD/ThiS family protein [Desulfovermiculus sp.]|nr:MoaD/ThiS family protein [Desulfovermiculus sp.]